MLKLKSSLLYVNCAYVCCGVQLCNVICLYWGLDIYFFLSILLRKIW